MEKNDAPLKTLYKVSPAGVFWADWQGGCIFVNPQWCEIAEIASEQAKGELEVFEEIAKFEDGKGDQGG